MKKICVFVISMALILVLARTGLGYTNLFLKEGKCAVEFGVKIPDIGDTMWMADGFYDFSNNFRIGGTIADGAYEIGGVFLFSPGKGLFLNYSSVDAGGGNTLTAITGLLAANLMINQNMFVQGRIGMTSYSDAMSGQDIEYGGTFLYGQERFSTYLDIEVFDGDIMKGDSFTVLGAEYVIGKNMSIFGKYNFDKKETILGCGYMF